MPVQTTEVHLRHSVVGVKVVSDDRLEAARVDPIGLPHDLHVLVLRLILWDRHVRRRVMFLVAHQNVRDQGTLAREERDGHLNCLTVPVL